MGLSSACHVEAQHVGTHTHRQSTSGSSSTCLCRQKCVLSPAGSMVLVFASAAHDCCNAPRAGVHGSVCARGVSVSGPASAGLVRVRVLVPAPLLRAPPG